MSGPIVPDLWLAGRDLTEPRQSPDGTAVAAVVTWAGRSALIIVPVGGGPERIVSSEPQPRPGRGFGGGCFAWWPDGGSLVYAAKDGGLWRVPAAGGVAERLVPGDPDRPSQSPVVHPGGRAIAWTVDLAEIRLAAAGPSGEWQITEVVATADFMVDPEWAPGGEELRWQQWSVPHMAWDESSIGWRASADGAIGATGAADRQMQQPRFAVDGSHWCVRDDAGWLNVWRGDRPVLAEAAEHAGPTWGPGQRTYCPSPDGSQVAIARNEGGFGRLVVVDIATGGVRQLGRGVHGQVDWRGGFVTALRSGGRTPTQIVAYDAATAERRVLAYGPVAGFDDDNLVEPELVTWPGHDGTTLHGRLYRPVGGGDGRLICWLHGGPTDQWQVTFIPRLAMYVQLGWTVLVPDHRGSTGHGRAYQQALRGRWGELDTADTVAALDRAHDADWGRREATVLMGSSAGGFTALNTALAAPESIAAVVALYPVTDLAALDDGTYRFEAHYHHTLVGNGDLGAERARAGSPLFRAGDVRCPVLLMHGDMDPVVPVEHSVRFARDARAAGADVEFVVFPGEGHGLRQPEHQRREVELTRGLLDRVRPPHSVRGEEAS